MDEAASVDLDTDGLTAFGEINDYTRCDLFGLVAVKVFPEEDSHCVCVFMIDDFHCSSPSSLSILRLNALSQCAVVISSPSASTTTLR